MSGLDLFSVQQDILDYVQGKFPELLVESGGVPELETLIYHDGVLEPYIILRFSELMPASRGSTWDGASTYEYYSYVDALCVGRNDTDAREVSSLVNRAMLSKKFPNASEIRKIFGGGGFAISDATRVPVAYISVASFAFTTNLEDVGSGSLIE